MNAEIERLHREKRIAEDRLDDIQRQLNLAYLNYIRDIVNGIAMDKNCRYYVEQVDIKTGQPYRFSEYWTPGILRNSMRSHFVYALHNSGMLPLKNGDTITMGNYVYTINLYKEQSK